jgi:hypothetical protein
MAWHGKPQDRVSLLPCVLMKWYPGTRDPKGVPLKFDGTEFTPSGTTHLRKDEAFNNFFETYGAQFKRASVAMHLEMRIADTRTGEIQVDAGSHPQKFTAIPENRSIPVVREISIGALPLLLHISRMTFARPSWPQDELAARLA